MFGNIYTSVKYKSEVYAHEAHAYEVHAREVCEIRQSYMIAAADPDMRANPFLDLELLNRLRFSTHL
jgi:hypothetical protein